MTDMIAYPHIGFKPGTDTPTIAGRRLSVKFMTIFLNDPEWPVERICEEYNLTPSQVYSAWAYYYDHKEEIDRAIAEDDEAYKRLVNDPARLAQVEALKAKKRSRGS